MRETYGTEDVLVRMAAVLGEGTRAEDATVWLRVDDVLRPEASWPAGSEPSAEVPGDAVEIVHQGEKLGALSVRMPANDPMDEGRERIVRDLAAQAGPVLRNVKLIEELRESRRRIVAAQDEERRKIERNIHDGAQQQLVALSVKARLARQLAERDLPKATEMLEQIEHETQTALEDLRDLARGIYPPLLADQGLPAALEAQARRSTVPVTVEADGCGRYGPEAEAAVYFSVLEALQNVAKYADATRAIVRLVDEDGDLSFEIRDDGRGFDPSAASYGTGLQGMADRLAAISGELAVSSTPGAGTRVSGRIPREGER
jgi:signal transduction histidine kinase